MEVYTKELLLLSRVEIGAPAFWTTQGKAMSVKSYNDCKCRNNLDRKAIAVET